jgi:hypothetical protein
MHPDGIKQLLKGKKCDILRKSVEKGDAPGIEAVSFFASAKKIQAESPTAFDPVPGIERQAPGERILMRSISLIIDKKPVFV